MKKLFFIIIVIFAISAILQGCGSKGDMADNSRLSETSESNISEAIITAEMAYEGVYNYCHSMYDWSIADDNQSIMYLKMGDESETEYEVIFRSYTGAFVNFYVNKSSGITRITEYVPTLDIESEAGTIDLFDYLKKQD